MKFLFISLSLILVILSGCMFTIVEPTATPSDEIDDEIDSGFDPLSLEPILFLRSDVGVIDDGGNVESWLDLSGNGTNFSQDTVSQQPTYLENSFGEKPGIFFDDVDDSLQAETGTFLNVTCSGWIAILGRVVTDTTNLTPALWVYENETNRLNRFLLRNQNKQTEIQERDLDTPDIIEGASVTADYHLWEFASDGDSYEIALDGDTTKVVTEGSDSGDWFCVHDNIAAFIGQFDDDIFADMELGAIFISSNDPITEQERQNVRNWLSDWAETAYTASMPISLASNRSQITERERHTFTTNQTAFDVVGNTLNQADLINFIPYDCSISCSYITSGRFTPRERNLIDSMLSSAGLIEEIDYQRGIGRRFLDDTITEIRR